MARIPTKHLLNKCELPDQSEGLLVVDVRTTLATHIDLLRAHAATQGERVRLLPPYREHLAQGFARMMMHVGLSEDVAAFS